jgi:hypothetical protein
VTPPVVLSSPAHSQPTVRTPRTTTNKPIPSTQEGDANLQLDLRPTRAVSASTLESHSDFLWVKVVAFGDNFSGHGAREAAYETRTN